MGVGRWRHWRRRRRLADRFGMTGTETGGNWVSVVEAGRRLGLSERSVRRQLASGKLVSVVQDGRRVVRLDAEPDAVTGRQATGGVLVEAKAVPSGGATGGAMLELAVRLADQRVEELRAELASTRTSCHRARRTGTVGWSLAAAGFVLAAAAAAWGVGRVQAADAARAIQEQRLAEQLERADQAERHARQLAELADAAVGAMIDAGTRAAAVDAVGPWAP